MSTAEIVMDYLPGWQKCCCIIKLASRTFKYLKGKFTQKSSHADSLGFIKIPMCEISTIQYKWGGWNFLEELHWKIALKNTLQQFVSPESVSPVTLDNPQNPLFTVFIGTISAVSSPQTVQSEVWIIQGNGNIVSWKRCWGWILQIYLLWAPQTKSCSI